MKKIFSFSLFFMLLLCGCFDDPSASDLEPLENQEPAESDSVSVEEKVAEDKNVAYMCISNRRKEIRTYAGTDYSITDYIYPSDIVWGAPVDEDTPEYVKDRIDLEKGDYWIHIYDEKGENLGWVNTRWLSRYTRFGETSEKTFLYGYPEMEKTAGQLAQYSCFAIEEETPDSYKVERILGREHVTGYISKKACLTGEDALDCLNKMRDVKSSSNDYVDEFKLDPWGTPLITKDEYVKVASKEGIPAGYSWDEKTFRPNCRLDYGAIYRIGERTNEEITVEGKTGRWVFLTDNTLFPISGYWCSDAELEPVDIAITYGDLGCVPEEDEVPWYTWTNRNHLDGNGIPRYDLNLNTSYYLFYPDGRYVCRYVDNEYEEDRVRYSEVGGTWELNENKGLIRMTGNFHFNLHSEKSQKLEFQIFRFTRNHLRLQSTDEKHSMTFDICRSLMPPMDVSSAPDKGRYFDTCQPFNDSDLIIAARTWSYDEAASLIAGGADLDHQNMYGLTALHMAVATMDISMVRLLLESGANPSIMSPTLPSPLEVTLFDSDDLGYELDSNQEEKLHEIQSLLLEYGGSTQNIERFWKTLYPAGFYFCPDKIQGEPLTVIPEKAFISCKDLTNLVLPDSIVEMGPMAFRDCSSLKTLLLPRKLQHIPDRCFEGCTSLDQVTIPGGVTSIGMDAFTSCESLEHIKIPEELTSLGDRAFFDCESLERIEIPHSIKRIEKETFCSCDSLKEVVLPQGLISIQNEVFEKCPQLATINFPDSLQFIAEDAFADSPLVNLEDQAGLIAEGFEHLRRDENLTEYTLPLWMTKLPDFTFIGCVNLESVALNEELSILGESAFEKCSSLNEIQLPQSLVTIGKNAFADCSGLTRIEIPKGSSLSTLEAGAFEKCSSLEEIHFPVGLAAIGSRAFAGCTGLTHVEIPEELKILNSDVFSGCKNLKEAVLPENLKEIRKNAFSGCDSLKSIDLPMGLERLGDRALAGTALERISIPDSVQFLGEGVLGSCSFLWEVNLPSSITVWPDSLFCYDVSLERISIPEGVTSLGEDCFRGCSRLKTLHFPESLQEIGKGCLEGCSSLETLIFENSEPIEMNGNQWAIPESCHVYVPGESVDLYQKALEGVIVCSREEMSEMQEELVDEQ
ncbi:leucine-rich repeat domain-containing protein [Spirochaeta cellobiosiphila]|uniref:leucine-rich repeat domain-containing protein n=1 Tax=Spirochaeta cellobiosiphila TaxID=504483 RepID=UPI000A022CEA|nr:leucine-rich repeat domain-containing protein [Spirochaeta cellobiosiphila]